MGYEARLDCFHVIFTSYAPPISRAVLAHCFVVGPDRSRSLCRWFHCHVMPYSTRPQQLNAAALPGHARCPEAGAQRSPRRHPFNHRSAAPSAIRADVPTSPNRLGLSKMGNLPHLGPLPTCRGDCVASLPSHLLQPALSVLYTRS